MFIKTKFPPVPLFWKSYLQTYIERDVRRVANIGSLQTFGNFIGLLSTHSSGEINYNQLGREIGVDRKSALAWTEIAQATFQWFAIPPFSRNPARKDIKGFASLKSCFPNEKFYTGLVICSIETPQMISEDVLALPWWII